MLWLSLKGSGKELVPLDIEIGPRPCGLGYVQGEIVRDNPFYPKGTVLLGHEFHYSRALPCEKSLTHLALTRGTGLGDRLDGLVINNTWASYTHIFAPAQTSWAPTLCGLAREWKSRKQNI